MMRHDDNADDGGYDDDHHQVREVGRLVVRDSAFLSLPTGAILIHSADQVFLDIVMIIVMTIAMNIVIVFAFRLKLLATKCLYLHLQQSQRGARYDDHPFTNHADHHMIKSSFYDDCNYTFALPTATIFRATRATIKILTTLGIPKKEKDRKQTWHPKKSDPTFRREATDLQVSSHLLLESGFPTAKQVGWAA